MRKDFDPAQMLPRDFYHLLTAVVVPRPIAWVSSTSLEGVDNLAPAFVLYGGVCGPARCSVHVRGRAGCTALFRSVIAHWCSAKWCMRSCPRTC
jgi:hypothetical protein